jgi:hypothetical protein
VAPRRAFRLPEDDEIYLDSTGLVWETLVVGRQRWIVLRDHPLPDGYTAGCAHVAVLVAPAYPAAPLDMAYFSPPLALTSGRAIPRSQFVQQFDGRQWQGWSRHRTGSNPWEPGVDSLKTHLALVRAWLIREVNR